MYSLTRLWSTTRKERIFDTQTEMQLMRLESVSNKFFSSMNFIMFTLHSFSFILDK
jgi:hypothetical protein